VGADAKRTAGFGGHLNLQYGEVVPQSVWTDVLGACVGPMGPADVFYDLGSGTGKIPLLAALWSGAWVPPPGARVGVVVCGGNCAPGAVA